MELFHIIDDGAAIIRVAGKVYKQTKIYRRGSNVYAAYSGGFIRLLRGSGTTHPNISWLDVEGPGVTINSGLPQYAESKKAKKPATVKAVT